MGRTSIALGRIYALHEPTSFPIQPIGLWNTYLIEANGSQINVTLNGIPINSYVGNRQANGYIALQAHDFPSRIQFRNLQIKKLPLESRGTVWFALCSSIDGPSYREALMVNKPGGSTEPFPLADLIARLGSGLREAERRAA